MESVVPQLLRPECLQFLLEPPYSLTNQRDTCTLPLARHSCQHCSSFVAIARSLSRQMTSPCNGPQGGASLIDSLMQLARQ